LFMHKSPPWYIPNTMGVIFSREIDKRNAVSYFT
jgi:hypothetical protein